MKFKESPYYNKDFLSTHLYNNIDNNDEIFTVQEYFGLNDKENKYIKKGKSKINEVFHYELIVYSRYYEFNCQDYDIIIVKNSENSYLSYCVSNKVIIDNNYKGTYYIRNSKISSVYFYNQKVKFLSSKVENFYIYNKYLIFDNSSFFLKHHKIKCFGKCDDLNKKILTSERFEERIVHIE